METTQQVEMKELISVSPVHDTLTISEQQSLNQAIGEDNLKKTLPDDVMNVAISYINDAIYLRSTDRATDPVALGAYRLYTNPLFSQWMVLVVLTHLVLAAWEEPCVRDSCGTKWVLLSIESVCVMSYIIQLTLSYLSRGYVYFWKSSWNIAEFVVTMVMSIDLIGVWFDDDWTHFSRILRIFFVMNFSDYSRDQTKQVVMTIIRMIPTIACIYGFVSIAALFGYATFSNRTPIESTPDYFGDYYISWRDMYITLTTGYRISTTYYLFFVGYYILGLYIGMNMVLGMVFSKYQHVGRSEMKQNGEDRRRALSLAFDMLDINKNGKLSEEEWDRLYFALHPKASASESKKFFTLVDTDGSGVLERSEFFNLCNVALLRFVKYDPKCHYYPRHLGLHAFLNHWIVESWMIVLMIINACIIIYAHDKPVDDPMWPMIVDTVILLLYVIELASRMYARGVYQYIRSKSNMFDLAIIAISLISKIVLEYVLGLSGDHGDLTFTLITVFRALRLLRVVTVLKPLRVLAASAVPIFTHLMRYFGILIIMFYAFAMLGMLLFKDVLVLGNEKLVPSDYDALNYYDVLNFNSFRASFVTLFMLMIGNNWFVVLNAVVMGTTRWSMAFFLSFHFTVCQVVLNIVVSFVIAALSFVRDKGSKGEAKYIMPGETHDEYDARVNMSHSLMEEMFGSSDGSEGSEEHDVPFVSVVTEAQLKSEISDQRRLIGQLLNNQQALMDRVAQLEKPKSTLVPI